MTTQAVPPTTNRLEHFPVTFFAVIMGMSGLTLALHAAQHAFDLADTIPLLGLLLTLVLFAAVSALYIAKAIRYPAAVMGEWKHPVRLAFFPAISVSILLLATALLGYDRAIAHTLWLIGALMQLVLTIAIVSGWIGSRSFLHATLSPAWFIPAVGNVIVPIAGAQLGYIELSWFFMSAGLLFWIILLTLVINRLIFHDPLPGKLQPTLVILIAPPAVAFMAWLNLVGELDAMARMLINAAYLFTLIVLVQLPAILRLPFAMSFWALSFPIAAVSIASFRYSAETGSQPHLWIALTLLIALIVTIAALLGRTLKAIVNGTICLPE